MVPVLSQSRQHVTLTGGEIVLNIVHTDVAWIDQAVSVRLLDFIN